MNVSLSACQEFDKQKGMLFCDVGIKGSGAARYSAAMYFYKQGRLSLEMLEICRRCSKFDHEDPFKLAEHEGIDLLLQSDFEFRAE